MIKNFNGESIELCTLILIVICGYCAASNGDRTQFFRNCCANCERTNCSTDGIEIQEQAVKYYQQTIFDRLLLWTCVDECQYGCMWRTVHAFQDRGWMVPQFYGKWPFIRLFGLQEPASVLFSILNLFSHIKMLQKFRKEVRSDSPCFKLWHIFAVICINGWVWSIVFHARDFPITELLDYIFAYSMVLGTFYCMLMRMLYKYSIFLRCALTIIFIFFYLNYFAYVSVGKFSYSFNMTINIITGFLSALGWLLWCFFVRKHFPYYKKMLRFYFLFGLSISLELMDFPPILWIVDAHALWHLATIPLCSIFYSFVIDDCKMLRKNKMLQETNLKKEL